MPFEPIYKDCGGDWSTELLEELFLAVDDFSSDIPKNLGTIVENTATYMIENYKFCHWPQVHADVQEHCSKKGNCTLRSTTLNFLKSLFHIPKQVAMLLYIYSSLIFNRSQEYIERSVEATFMELGSYVGTILGFTKESSHL